MLKVYGMNLDGKRRGIVATTSWAKAAKAAGITISRAQTYGSVTGNAAEIALAMTQPGVCIIRSTTTKAGCEWFAACGRPAVHLTPHPALGDVPTCERCHKWATS